MGLSHGRGAPGKGFVAAVVIALLAGSAIARGGGEEDARDHYRKGMAEYALFHYDAAIHEFEEGFREKQEPAFLFNIAQAHRKAGRRGEALAFYRRYLELAPDSSDRGEIEKEIGDLERELDAKAAQLPNTAGPVFTPPSAAPAKAPPPAYPPSIAEKTAAHPPPAAQTSDSPPSAAAAQRDARRMTAVPRFKDAVAWTLAGGALIAGGIGGGLIARGQSSSADVNSTSDPHLRSQLQTDGQSYGISGYVLVGVAGALLVAAIVKWAIRPSVPKNGAAGSLFRTYSNVTWELNTP